MGNEINLAELIHFDVEFVVKIMLINQISLLMCTRLSNLNMDELTHKDG